MKPLAVLVGALLLTACRGSPPSRYYMLSVVPGAPAAEGIHSPQADSSIVPLRLEQVRLPGELDRSQLVRRLDANRLWVEPVSRWAAPLDGMIRRVLSANLALRLPPGAVADPYQTTPEARPLSVDVQELYGDSGCSVRLSATWVLAAQTRPLPGQLGTAPVTAPGMPQGATEDLRVPAQAGGGCPEALAATMSQALGVLADRIAAAIVSAKAAPTVPGRRPNGGPTGP